MPEVNRITILTDSVEIGSAHWYEAPLLSDFARLFDGTLREVTTRTIKGVPCERVFAIDDFGLTLSVELPEERVRGFRVFFFSDEKWVRGNFQGTMSVNGAELRKGARVSTLLRGAEFKFVHRIAIGEKVSLMYQPKHEFVGNINVSFERTEPMKTAAIKERVAQLHALN